MRQDGIRPWVLLVFWIATPAAIHSQAEGRYRQASQTAGRQRLAGETALAAGDLTMVLQQTGDGVRLQSLFDSAADRELLADARLPLFTLKLRDTQSKQEVTVSADAGWGQVEVLSGGPDKGIELRWRRPKDKRLEGLAEDLLVLARATADRQAGAIRWKLDVENESRSLSVLRVVFPQVALAEPGPQAEVFVPRAPGEVQRGLWQRGFRHRGTYPSGWTSMPFLAAYDCRRKTGLYFAVHDPWGSTKDITAEGRPPEKAVVFSFDHPAADMGRPGNRFRLAGEAVWRLLRGDWFDAATIYRDWVRREAKWFPELTPEGRADTPRWMRELPVWVMTGGGPEACVKEVEQFAKMMGVPVGFHWYNWHQIPFDNDYPHYFPTKKGFAEAVARLQASGVYVMPYINGRLWDTRDKGAEDFEFGRLALPAATKDEQGKPRVETYGSKETDGSRVQLAAMCPATQLWQQRVRRIVLRLFDECGVKAVYIDQVAAAQPRLCFDPGHGHPLGGGHWWTEAYWKMLEAIRRAKPPDRMLTTECNADAYVKWFDGYLTWHWQYDGQVPAFAAVYGGSIQMFGRAYRGGETKDLALRMKAGQQLVFGEQIGWFHPNVVNEKANAEFLRRVVSLRWELRRYFYAGEMARPPKLAGQIPKVRADWQWSGEWWVTTDAAMAGAWRLPQQNKCVLLFVNVGDQPVSTSVELDAGSYGLSGEKVRLTVLGGQGPNESFDLPRVSGRELKLPPRSALAWELSVP